MLTLDDYYLITGAVFTGTCLSRSVTLFARVWVERRGRASMRRSPEPPAAHQRMGEPGTYDATTRAYR